MLSRREMVMVIFLLVLVAGTGYFLLFFQPTTQSITAARASVETKEQELFDLTLLAPQYEALKITHDDMLESWEEFKKSVPDNFDVAEVLYILQKIIYPYTRNITVGFPEGEEGGSDGGASPVEVNTVTLSFSVSYNGLMDILDAFSKETLMNRVINYSVSRSGGDDMGDLAYSVSMSLDFLSQRN